jgi:sigma-B regulation protein RsbU (phosphoserine phosphatase)
MEAPNKTEVVPGTSGHAAAGATAFPAARADGLEPTLAVVIDAFGAMSEPRSAVDLGGAMGEALPRARPRAESWKKTFMRQDLVAAREVQRTFLPRFPGTNSAGVRVVAEYLPAFAVGGDFYEFIDLGDGKVLAAIGDVSGKGVNAALVMARLSSEFRRLSSETANPGELLSLLNRSLAARLQEDRFATVLCVHVDVPAGRWVLANAGHPAPLLRRRDGGVSRLARASGPPIGIEATINYDEQVCTAAPGDILILVTDGAFELVDAGVSESAHIGPCRMTDLVAAGPHDVGAIARRIVASAESTAERDDVALLGLQLP